MIYFYEIIIVNDFYNIFFLYFKNCLTICNEVLKYNLKKKNFLKKIKY